MGSYIRQPDLNKLLERYEGISSDLGDVALECVQAGSQQLYDEFREGLEKHRRTGAGVRSLKMCEPVSDGTRVSGEVGTFYDSDERFGFLHTIYQEYGSPRFPADPWCRPVCDKAKTTLGKVYRKILKEHLEAKK